MNETSSRSHAVFTMKLTRKKLDAETNVEGEKVNRREGGGKDIHPEIARLV